MQKIKKSHQKTQKQYSDFSFIWRSKTDQEVNVTSDPSDSAERIMQYFSFPNK